ncbi:MAG TPA: sigma-54-dependent Fis family transcriptional regulator [Pelotomaculum sp.]|nr:sigma-54-dependent Fis family transcriptional regulator [Pelotomaculum sp.]
MASNLDAAPQNITSAWKKLITAAEIDTTVVRAEIAQSWQRCYQAGVDPSSGVSRLLLDPRQLQKLLEKKSELIDIARPFMGNLYQFVAGSGFIVMLSDEKGYIMEAIGDSDTLANASELNLSKGASWVEEEVGTNGIGTALAIRNPVQISGAEHYCKKVHAWTCSAAPICNDQRQIIGALQMSGPSEKSHKHTLGMIVAAVKAIEDRLRLQHSHRNLARLNNHLNNIFFTVSDGVITVDKDGRIDQLNPAAEKLLNHRKLEIIGKAFADFIDKPQKIKDMLTSGTAYHEANLTVSTGQGHVHCLSSGKPMEDDHKGITGGVIFINPLNKIKRLINRFSGAHATFHFTDIVGKNPRLLKAVQLAIHAADSHSNVLLQGESGTGKEVFAQAIHNGSARSNGPFVAVNCGAIPRELIGSELFGYEEGAFTGALRGGRPGKFELASGGTLFLDEIGDMPLEQQVALLRVLQDKQVTRLGDSKAVVVDVRIICASNKNLHQEAERGNFRKDLFYRLNVISINLPPLRERREDIPLLFDMFFKEVCRKTGIDIHHINPRVIACLQEYEWPGNMREFQNVLERMVNIADGNTIEMEHLPEEILSPRPKTQPPDIVPPTTSCSINAEIYKIKAMLDEEERREILSMLYKNKGNISRVAKDMNMSRNTLYRKMRKLGIQ